MTKYGSWYIAFIQYTFVEWMNLKSIFHIAFWTSPAGCLHINMECVVYAKPNYFTPNKPIPSPFHLAFSVKCIPIHIGCSSQTSRYFLDFSYLLCSPQLSSYQILRILFFLKTALLRYDLHTMKFTFFKGTIQYMLVFFICLLNCTTITTI